MYTDEDLKSAIEKGIFTEPSVAKFRAYIAELNSSPSVDEENFRLIASFNDIFVVIACVLLLGSSARVSYSVHPALALGIVAILSWGLAEFFVLKRNMALPAIVLLVSFVCSVFTFFVFLFESPSEKIFMLAASLSTVAVWLHWKRFNVPITVAAGAAVIVIFVISLFVSIFPDLKDYVLYLVFLGGVITFSIAMFWDSADLTRVTRKSDVAFWLHLVSAPMIVHPIFTNLGILEGDESLNSIAVIVVLYIVLTIVSLVIDRRAFMVSSLIYVLFALTTLLKTYGLAGDSFAFVGVFIGFSLLLLSGFWHKVRSKLVMFLPETIQDRVPLVRKFK